MGTSEVTPRRHRTGAAAAVTLGTAVAYQRFAEQRDPLRFPPPGQFASVGDPRLHWVDHGGAGTPIMIETGAGSLAIGWSGIVADLAGRGHIYSDDRAGMGWVLDHLVDRTQ